MDQKGYEKTAPSWQWQQKKRYEFLLKGPAMPALGELYVRITKAIETYNSASLIEVRSMFNGSPRLIDDALQKRHL